MARTASGAVSRGLLFGVIDLRNDMAVYLLSVVALPESSSASAVCSPPRSA